MEEMLESQELRRDVVVEGDWDFALPFDVTVRSAVALLEKMGRC